jgi:hypothetical protein
MPVTHQTVPERTLHDELPVFLGIQLFPVHISEEML